MEKQRKHEEIEKKAISIKRQLFGERYANASISQLTIPIWAQNKLQQFLKSPKNFLVFCGNPGIGKTYFCAALIDWAIKNFNTFRVWKEALLFQKLRASIKDNQGDYLQILTGFIDDELIILDDVGSQGVNEWREEVIFDALDFRYNQMLPTIITSNFSKKDFQEIYHPRVSSRLFAAENTIIEMHDAPDLRLQGL